MFKRFFPGILNRPNENSPDGVNRTVGGRQEILGLPHGSQVEQTDHESSRSRTPDETKALSQARTEVNPLPPSEPEVRADTSIQETRLERVETSDVAYGTLLKTVEQLTRDLKPIMGRGETKPSEKMVEQIEIARTELMRALDTLRHKVESNTVARQKKSDKTWEMLDFYQGGQVISTYRVPVLKAIKQALGMNESDTKKVISTGKLPYEDIIFDFNQFGEFVSVKIRPERK